MNSPFSMLQLALLLPLITGTSAVPSNYATASARCSALPQKLAGRINATSTYIIGGDIVEGTSQVPSCDFGTPSEYTALANLCRVTATIPTSNRSEVKLEAWLPDPDAWQGRFLATGNGGLGGCFVYPDLQYGSGYYRMATVNTNNGHDGNTGAPFLNNPDVLTDYVYRALVVEHDVGLEITEAYYGSSPSRKYYLGCSTGGRQGMYLAQHFPDLFDGIIAGAPAMDILNLENQLGRLGLKNGFRSNPADTSVIVGLDDLPVITAEVLRQCDKLDGVKNGIIDDPDKCKFQAEKLLCSKAQLAAGNTTGVCLTREKVDVVREIFTPLYGPGGKLLYPRFDPGFTASAPYLFNGFTWTLFLEGYRYIIYNDSSYNLDNFSMKDINAANKVDPDGVSTWERDLSKLRKSGTKLLSYHGTADGIIPGGNTIRYYNEVKKTMKARTLDPFWKHFVIPGMEHCSLSTTSASAPWNFGQASAPPQGLANDTSHNLLWSLVAWVEEGKSPKEIIGTKFVNDDSQQGIDGQRRYCPYPKKSVLCRGKNPKKADSWKCV